MVIVLLGGKLAGRCGVPIRVDDAVIIQTMSTLGL